MPADNRKQAQIPFSSSGYKTNGRIMMAPIAERQHRRADARCREKKESCSESDERTPKHGQVKGARPKR